MEPVKSLPLESWPERDRQAWLQCTSSPLMLDSPQVAGLRQSTKKLTARAYGEWLQWLADQHMLNDDDPGARITRKRVRSFVESQLERGLALSTVARSLQSLITAVSGICPAVDLNEIRKMSNRVKKRSKHLTKPKAFIVHATRMFKLGLDVMCEARGSAASQSLDMFVDGLIIAMLTACPLRIGDFSALRLDKEIFRNPSVWRVLTEVSKMSKIDACTLPRDLAPYIDEYVEIVRPRLILRQGQTSTDRFFIGTSGLPMNSQVMRRRIEALTAAEFCQPVLPHSFRKLAVTTLILEEPKHAASAHALLGHGSSHMTEDHYFIGQQVIALRRYHDCLDRRSISSKGQECSPESSLQAAKADPLVRYSFK